jgi:hypothetical protein
MLRLHGGSISHVTLAAYGASCPAVMRQVSQSRRDILSQTLLRGHGDRRFSRSKRHSIVHEPSRSRRGTQVPASRERNYVVCPFCEIRNNRMYWIIVLFALVGSQLVPAVSLTGRCRLHNLGQN